MARPLGRAAFRVVRQDVRPYVEESPPSSDNDRNGGAVTIIPDDRMVPLRAILTVSPVCRRFPARFEIVGLAIWDNPPVQVVQTPVANDVDIAVRCIEEESSAIVLAELVHQLHRTQDIFVREVTCGPNPRWQ